MAAEACGFCRYYVNGYCRRYPPVPVYMPGYEDVAMWPSMLETQWCGEFKRETKGQE